VLSDTLGEVVRSGVATLRTWMAVGAGGAWRVVELRQRHVLFARGPLALAKAGCEGSCRGCRRLLC